VYPFSVPYELGKDSFYDKIDLGNLCVTIQKKGEKKQNKNSASMTRSLRKIAMKR